MNQQEIERSSSNDQALIGQNQAYVDKTGIIAELLHHRHDASLITRPRRFGQSLLIPMLLSSAPEENDALDFAVVTGCLRISQASIFTGLSSFVVCDFENPMEDEILGFTEEETRRFLSDDGLESPFGQVRDWYDGCNIAGREGDHPFSICRCIPALPEKTPKPFKPYWIGTSARQLVYDMILQQQDRASDLAALACGEELDCPVYNRISDRDFSSSADLTWTIARGICNLSANMLQPALQFVVHFKKKD